MIIQKFFFLISAQRGFVFVCKFDVIDFGGERTVKLLKITYFNDPDLCPRNHSITPIIRMKVASKQKFSAWYMN